MGLRATSAKNMAVENGVDGTLVAAAVWVDEHVKEVTEDRAKFGHNVPMEVNETRQLSWSKAERISAIGESVTLNRNVCPNR